MIVVTSTVIPRRGNMCVCSAGGFGRGEALYFSEQVVVSFGHHSYGQRNGGKMCFLRVWMYLVGFCLF